MKRTSKLAAWPVLILLVAVSSGCAREEPGVEIPLNKIWAYQMPETQNIHLLEPDHFGPAARQLSEQNPTDLYNSSLSHQIYLAIGRRADEKQPIGSGFAVAGTGHEALAAVKEIMEHDRMPLSSFSLGTEVTLFFHTRDFGRNVHLKKVFLSKKTITIYYQFIPHFTRSTDRYFALIPLGEIPAVSYAVDIVLLPMEDEYKQKGFYPVSKETMEKHVCKSFAFTVMHDEKEASNSE